MLRELLAAVLVQIVVATGADRAAREIERFHAVRAERQADLPSWAVA